MLLYFLTYMQLVPTSRTLERAVPSTWDTLPLFHPWPAPSPHASLSHKVTAQEAFHDGTPPQLPSAVSLPSPCFLFSEQLSSYTV